MSPLAPLAATTTEAAFAQAGPGHLLCDSCYIAYYKWKRVPAERERAVLVRHWPLHMMVDPARAYSPSMVKAVNIQTSHLSRWHDFQVYTKRGIVTRKGHRSKVFLSVTAVPSRHFHHRPASLLLDGHPDYDL